MADSASESDSSSVDGMMMPPSPVTREQLHKRIESLQQQNRVLKVELDTFKLRVKTLQEENRALRQTSVNIQAKAEQEEEFISNTLMKQIQTLKKEKETLAHTFEQEEECLTNDLSRKLNKLRAEKCKLEQTLEQEQECLVNKLMRKIEKLEAETCAKQNNLEQLRREKVELENTLEQEQEALVNRLWKRMDKLEAEKRNLQNKVSSSMSMNVLGGPGPVSSTTTSSVSVNDLHMGMAMGNSVDVDRIRRQSSGSQTQGLSSSQLEDSGNGSLNSNSSLEKMATTVPSTPTTESELNSMSGNVQHLKNEVDRLKSQLSIAQNHHTEKMSHIAMEERQIREENLRLHRRLQLEMERREQLCRHLSESESSLEMEDERHFHESLLGGVSNIPTGHNSGSLVAPMRPRPGSSPGPFMPSPGGGSRPLSPGLHLGNCSGNRDRGGDRDIMSPPSPVNRCHMCNGHGWIQPLIVSTSGNSGPFSHVVSSSSPPIRNSLSRERFARPAPPTAGDRNQGERDSSMSSPAQSPAPFEVMSPSAPSPSPMDTSKN